MNYKQIITDMKQGKFKPVYVLHGLEPYFIDEITKAAEKYALSEDEKSFNQSVFYGKDTDVHQVIESAKRFPMMAERQVVIVREAQDLKKIEELEEYMASPSQTTVLVIAHKRKKADARKKWLKNAKKTGVIFESKPVYDNQVPDWVADYLKREGYEISPKACALIAEFLGTDLTKITNELEKLKLNLPEGKTIDEQDVEKNIGISKDYNNFELQNAIGSGDRYKATQIVQYFSQNTKDHPPIVTMSVLSRFFSQVMCIYFEKNRDKNIIAKKIGVHPFFVKDYLAAARTYNGRKVMENITLLREYDAMYKGVDTGNIEDGELLKELVYKLMN